MISMIASSLRPDLMLLVFIIVDARLLVNIGLEGCRLVVLLLLVVCDLRRLECTAIGEGGLVVGIGVVPLFLVHLQLGVVGREVGVLIGDRHVGRHSA